MRTFGTLVRRTARLAVAAAMPATALGLALGLALGTGAQAAEAGQMDGQVATASAARAAVPATTSVTWHKLSLKNGWASSQGAYGTGDPSWTVRGGIVYLSGSLHQASGTSPVFASLPKAARPARRLYISVYTYASSTGTLVIGPDGAVSASSVPASNATQYTSLAGISFPARGTARHALALRNGWASSQGAYGTGDPSYSVSHGVVYLSGSMHRASGTQAIAGTLPPAARPATIMYVAVYTFAGSVGELAIEPNGTVLAFGSESAAYTSLAGVSYLAAGTARHALALKNGWKPAAAGYHTGKPAYSVSNGIVCLAGVLSQPSGANNRFSTLPAAARPAHSLWIQVFTADDHVGTVLIRKSGAMLAWSLVATYARAFTELDSLCYPLKS